MENIYKPVQHFSDIQELVTKNCTMEMNQDWIKNRDIYKLIRFNQYFIMEP